MQSGVGIRADELWTAADRGTVQAALTKAGYDRQVANRLALESERELKLAASDVVTVVETFLANRPKFQRAGAIGYRLRNGQWPVDGVVSLEDVRRREAAKSSAAEHNRLESDLFRIVKDGRSKDQDHETIRSRLRAVLPIEFCVSNGW
jgi:hypothetical protein